MKAITENQLHDFLINNRYSCKKYCLHNSRLLGITITVDPQIKFGIRKKYCLHNSTLLGITIKVHPPIKFGLRKGEHLFRQKVVIFPSFSSVIMNFFSPIGLISPIDPLHQKYQKPDIGSCQSTKIDTFLDQFDPTFSQIFPVTPIFSRF